MPAPHPRFMQALARQVAHHPGRVVGLWLAAVLLAGLACLRLSPGARLSDMLGDSSPEATAFNHVLDHYALADELLIVVTPEDAGNERVLLPGMDHDQATGPVADRVRQTSEELAGALADEAQLKAIGAEVRPAPAQEVRSFIEKVAIRRAVSYLPAEALPRLNERLTEAAMRGRFALLRARLNAPGAAGEIARQMAKDPLELRDFLPLAFPAMDAAAKGGKGGAADAMDFRPAAAQTGPPVEISPDGRCAVIHLAGSEGATVMPYAEALVSGAERALAPLRGLAKARGLRVELAGPYALATTSARTAKHDFTWSTIETIALIILAYVLLYRRPQGLNLLVACTFIPLLVGFGAYALLCGRITPLTAVAGAVLAGLGIDYAIHALHYHQRLRREGMNDADAARHTATDQLMPLLGACISACVGFAAIAATRTPAMRQLALLAVLSLAASFLAALTLLPAAMVLIGRRKERRQGAGAAAPAAPMEPRFAVGRLACALAQKPGIMLSVFGLACALGAAGTLMGYLHPARGAGLYALHPEPNPALEAQAHMGEHFGKTEGMALALVKAGNEGALLKTCAQVREVGQAAGYRVMSVADLVPESRREARPPVSGGPSAGQEVHDRLLLAAKAEGFNPKAFAGYAAFLRDNLDLPPPSFADLPKNLAGMVLPKNGPASPTETLAILTPLHPWENAQARDADISHLRQSMAQVPNTVLTGPDVLSVVMRQQVREDLPLALGLAALGIFLWHALTCRNVLDTVLSLVPSVFGLLAAASVAWMKGVEWNAITLAALPLIMGTGVDGNLFIVLFARDRAGLGTHRALEEFDKGTIAMLMIALTTLAGFGTLVFGSAPAVRDLGLLTSVGVLGAVFTSLACIMPVLWLAEARRKS